MNNQDFENELKEQYRQLNSVLDKETILTPDTVRKYKRQRIRLHLLDWLIYAIAAFAMLFALYMLIREAAPLTSIGASAGAAMSQPEGAAILPWALAITLLALVAVLWCFSLTPRQVELTPEMIRIRLWIGKEEIPYSQIVAIEPLDYSGRNIRLCGTSGVKARIGWFWNSRIGVYKAFITNRQDSILVTLRSGKKRAFSVAHPADVIDAIRTNLEHA
ncbi:MAG: hypothetical protein KBS77_06890 [Bacteroidales bacterium]|nr:hypothetical protein [Candidatus Colicola faecequi]